MLGESSTTNNRSTGSMPATTRLLVSARVTQCGPESVVDLAQPATKLLTMANTPHE
jgi:hypothetical protein